MWCWQWCDCRRMEVIYGPESPSFFTLFKFKAHLSYIRRRQFTSRISTLDSQATSPNSFLKHRNVHPQIRRKGRICIRRYIWWVQFILERSICLFRGIPSASKELPRDEDQVQNLWDQEIALVKLGELYRDRKWDLFIPLGYILPKELV